MGSSAVVSTNSFLTPEGIELGNRMFSEPRRYPRVGGAIMTVPSEQGLYAILTPDARCGPRPFAVLYVGEARDLKQRLTANHEKYPEWVRRSSHGNVYFACHATPGMTYEQRREAEAALIEQYRPPCNVRMDARSSLRALYWMRMPPPAKMQ